MARTARDLGSVLVHYGSDFVFDGGATRPYVETDPPNPQSVYATSKLLGEWFAADYPRGYVLRVESLFGGVGASSRKGSLYGIVNALKTGAVPRVIGDRTVSPTFVIDAARATLDIVERQPGPGLYHCVNGGHPTWLEGRKRHGLFGVEAKFDVAARRYEAASRAAEILRAVERRQRRRDPYAHVAGRTASGIHREVNRSSVISGLGLSPGLRPAPLILIAG
jgi:dTDP-4-dehydrorhamnose reductase